ncbi:MAG: LamG-like jellyroll fold domain-containing protein [Patescibacteria group bacterium]
MTTENRKQKTENKTQRFCCLFSVICYFTRRALRVSRGFTLFYAVLVTSLLLALGLAVYNITLKELILTSDARESQNAFYAADTALECALYWDLQYDGLSPAFGFYGDSLASGIVNYWRMDEGSGDDVFDTGSGNNDGLILGINGSDGPNRIPGYINDALSFDGAGDYVGLEEETSYAGEFTVSFWAQPQLPTQTGGGRTIVAKSGASDRFSFVFTTQNKYRLRIDAQNHEADMPASFSGWTHFVVIRKADNSLQVQVNGGAPTSLGTSGGDFSVQFIGQNGGNAGWYSGTLDDLRIYNRALSDEEIDAIVAGDANNIFVPPVAEMSNILCAEADISDPETGWYEDSNGNPLAWVSESSGESATTTFDLSLEDGRCALVTVTKNTSSTTIVARGYNTCEISSNRRLERALRAEY